MSSHVPEEGLAGVVRESTAFIANSVGCGGRCLVHGVLGMSRSAVLVVAYIVAVTSCTEQ